MALSINCFSFNCSIGQTALSSYLLADVESLVSREHLWLLGQGGGCRPGPLNSGKHPQELPYISQELGSCSGERPDFLFIYILGSLSHTLKYPRFTRKETNQVCVWLVFFLPILFSFFLFFFTCSFLFLLFVSFIFFPLYLLLKRTGLFRKVDTTRKNIKITEGQEGKK